MIKEMKGFVTGVITTTLLFSIVFTAFAEPMEKTITALYDNIKIYVDGSLIQPKDLNGNSVEPFIYDGTTYLPVRAISEALGKQVSWDENTNSVYIGESSKNNYMSDVIKPFDISTGGKCEVNPQIVVDGIAYDKGYSMYTLNQQNCLAKFRLDGEYSNVSGVLGLDDNCRKNFFTVEIYGDGKIIETYILKDGAYSAKINWNVTGIKELAIKGYGFSGEAQLDLADLVLIQNANLSQPPNLPGTQEVCQLTGDDVTVKMSAGIDMIGVLVAFPEGVTDILITDISKSSGRFKPCLVEKYEYNFFNRAGTQNSTDAKGLEYFSEGEELELTITYTYKEVKKTAVITKKILPAM